MYRKCNALDTPMKTATLPSLRVDPELRRAVEHILHPDESLSSFVEQAIRQTIAYRQAEQEFIARGLSARDHAQQTGNYVEAAAVVNRLQGILDQAKANTPR
jgi:predicted transcriptional regulator